MLPIYFVCCVTFVCIDLIRVFNDLLCICCDFGWVLFCCCVSCGLWVDLLVMFILVLGWLLLCLLVIWV